MITPYLTFHGNCCEAMRFYQTVFNSAIEMSQQYGDYIPENVINVPEDLRNWILHAQMQICGTCFWFADEITESVTAGNMIKLNIIVSTAREAQRIFDCLNTNAYITLPPTETFYSAFHAGLTDKFGICWNIVAEEVSKK